MNDIGICDYSDYDYKTDFWENANRKYEHQLEQKMVAKLLKSYVTTFNSILDAGCGFGRMAASYQDLFSKCHMVDFAQNLLKQADEQLKPKEKFRYYKQSLYELNIDNLLMQLYQFEHFTILVT